MSEIELLTKLSKAPNGLTSGKLGPADRSADRVRQKLRKAGLIVFENRGDKLRWFITQKGHDVLGFEVGHMAK
jgi:hypothetical protein